MSFYFQVDETRIPARRELLEKYSKLKKFFKTHDPTCASIGGYSVEAVRTAVRVLEGESLLLDESGIELVDLLVGKMPIDYIEKYLDRILEKKDAIAEKVYQYLLLGRMIIVKERVCDGCGEHEAGVGSILNSYPNLAFTYTYGRITRKNYEYIVTEKAAGVPLSMTDKNREIYQTIFYELLNIQSHIEYTHYDLNHGNIMVEEKERVRDYLISNEIVTKKVKYKITFIDYANNYVHGQNPNAKHEATVAWLCYGLYPSIYDPYADIYVLISNYVYSDRSKRFTQLRKLMDLPINNAISIRGYRIKWFPGREFVSEMLPLYITHRRHFVGDYPLIEAESERPFRSVEDKIGLVENYNYGKRKNIIKHQNEDIEEIIRTFLKEM